MPYELEWQRLVSLAVALCIGAVAIAVFVFRPKRRANRRLGLMLFAQAVGLGGGWSLGMMATDPDHATVWIVAGWVAFVAYIPLYLLFLATLRTPLVRTLTWKPVASMLWLLAILGAVLVVVRTGWFFEGLLPRAGHRTFLQAPGPLGTVIPAIHMLPLPIFGLIVAVHQWLRAPPAGPERRRASAYALAFGWRDASLSVLLVVLSTTDAITDSDPLPTLIYGGIELVFMLLVVYGILSTQLFDIDVKARLVIRQSTFVAAAGVLFFVISEMTEQLVDFEGALSALLWAAIVALAFRPLQSLSRRVAARALPPSGDPDELERRIRFYDAAVAEFEADGRITPREAAALDRLRKRLGLTETGAGRLDRQE